MNETLPFCPIVTPVFDHLKARTAESFAVLDTIIQIPHMMKFGDSNIIHARNEAARVTLQASPQARGLFWIDSDMVFTPDDVLHLLRRFAETDKMISGVYVSRLEPHNVTAFTFSDDHSQNLANLDLEEIDMADQLAVEAVGLGFCITPIRFFKQMKEPWFNLPPELANVGEDIAFCRRVRRQLKEEILLETSVRVGHVGEKIWTLEDAKDA